MIYRQKATTSPGPCISPVGGADAPEHRYFKGPGGPRGVCIGCGKIEPNDRDVKPENTIAPDQGSLFA